MPDPKNLTLRLHNTSLVCSIVVEASRDERQDIVYIDL